MMREVIAKPLDVASASAHGLQVITAPASPSAAQKGNQGTALVVRKLVSFPSLYATAPSRMPSSCNTAYFRCAPRQLIPAENGKTRLQIKVFERHPYTRQAFFPMGRDAKNRAYVVVVTEDKSISFWHIINTDGAPDLNKVEAFVAMGNQGIVYEANRWHSPMCGLDEVFKPVISY